MTRKTMASRRRTPADGRLPQLKALTAAGLTRLDRAADGLGRSLLARPRWTAAAVGLVTAGLLLGELLGDSPSPEPGFAASRPAVIPPLPAPPTDTVTTTPPVAGAVPASDEPAEITGTSAKRDWHTVTIHSGETLEIIFRRLGLGPGLLHEVVHLDEHTRTLPSIRPGDTFDFDLGPDDEFRAMRASLDENRWLLVEREDEDLATTVINRELMVERVEVAAEIRSSLFVAGKEAGLSDGMIMRLAGIFGWDIDLALDLRTGDRFALVYERIHRDGEFLRDGDILAARFVNQGRSFEAVRFETPDGPDYYAPDGLPMRKAFLRSPLNFTRVTSNFNPRRFHPVLKRVRPHNGTDYGAATGTPVWASGDGKVIEAAYNQANGNYVFIKHGNNIVTKYLHLSKRHVKRGDRVKQGETIGRVGATGLATAAHLHYEFLVNGVHRNPRTVDLPEADPLPAEHLPEFRKHARPLLARLDGLDPEVYMIASSEDGPASRQ